MWLSALWYYLSVELYNDLEKIYGYSQRVESFIVAQNRKVRNIYTEWKRKHIASSASHLFTSRAVISIIFIRAVAIVGDNREVERLRAVECIADVRIW